MTSQQTTATLFDGLQSRLDQIVQKYDELQELLASFGYELVIDDRDLDVQLVGGDFLFTLDILERSDY